MKEDRKLRNTGLDIIRTCASLFTIAGHFFVLNTCFKQTEFEGVSMFIQAMANFFFKGTPLFMLLTGYLINKKVFGKIFYNGGIKVIVSYIIFSIITLIFRDKYLNQNIDWIAGIKMTLAFEAIPYAWYIEMWIGLFLLAPFLNILYHGIDNQRNKRYLILILFLLTALPDLFNRYGLHLVPGYWSDLYPITYYYIGAYIREYQPRIKKWTGVIIIIAICSINPIFNTLFVKNHSLIQICGGPSGVFGVIIAVTFFLLLYQLEIRSNWIKRLFAKTSQVSLSIYLCCYIFDILYYPYFKEHYFISQAQFGIFFFILVPLVYTSSFTVAWGKEFILNKLQKTLLIIKSLPQQNR